MTAASDDSHRPAQVQKIIMMAVFIQITSQEKKTFYQKITTAMYNFRTVVMTATNSAWHPVDGSGSFNPSWN
jgi:hypothetical protein